MHAYRVPAQRHDRRAGGRPRLQRLLPGRGDQLRGCATADLRAGPGGARGGAAPAQRCGPDLALSAPRRQRVRCRPHRRRGARRLRAVGAHAVRRGAAGAGCGVLCGAGKPGCGASTLAAHLAIHLHSGGANPVLLVDGDYLTASIAFILKLKPQFHVEDALRDWARMDNDLWSRLTVPSFGVDGLAAPEDPTTRTEVSRKIAGELCAFWREHYEAVVLDLPDVRAAVDCGFAALADILLLVTTNELAALQATGRGLRYLDAGSADRGKLRLILNRYTPVTGLNREDVKTALALEPFAVLSNDYEVIQAALLEGKPAPPGSRFGASVQALCRHLSHNGAPSKKNTSWLASLLHKK